MPVFQIALKGESVLEDEIEQSVTNAHSTNICNMFTIDNCTVVICVKGTVHPEMKIQSLFSQDPF